MADAAYPALILETRKTAPGLRLVDKWAVYTISSVLLWLYVLVIFNINISISLMNGFCFRYLLVEVGITEWDYLIWC